MCPCVHRSVQWARGAEVVVERSLGTRMCMEEGKGVGLDLCVPQQLQPGHYTSVKLVNTSMYSTSVQATCSCDHGQGWAWCTDLIIHPHLTLSREWGRG